MVLELLLFLICFFVYIEGMGSGGIDWGYYDMIYGISSSSTLIDQIIIDHCALIIKNIDLSEDDNFLDSFLLF